VEQVTTENIESQSHGGGQAPAIPPLEYPLVAPVYVQAHLLREYTFFNVDSRYEKDTGLRVMTVSGPHTAGSNSTENVSNEVVRVHRGAQKVYRYWSCERIGEQPQIPHGESDNPNEVLEQQIITGCSPLTLPNGKIWRVSGINVYGLLKPLNETVIWPLCSSPAEVDGSAMHNIRPEHFDRNIMRTAHADPQLQNPDLNQTIIVAPFAGS
jgi:hypothetical protein